MQYKRPSPVRLRPMESYGYGPWHVALLQDCKGSTTKIVTHTHISLLLDAMYEVSKRKEKWIPVVEVGPFSRLQDAQAFAKEWTEGARGVDSRIAYGERLYRESPVADLHLSIQCVSATTFSHNRQWATHTNLKVPTGAPPWVSLVPTVKQIQLIEKERAK